MLPISAVETQRMLINAGIEIADTNLGIGRQLTSITSHPRIVNITLDKNENPDAEINLAYIITILETLLSVEDQWLLLPRYGSVTDLIPNESTPAPLSILFDPSERDQLVGLLCQLYNSGEMIHYDVYILGHNCQVMAAWDHHVFQDGMSVRLNNVEQSNRLITSLNAIGAEFNVYYTSA